MGFLGVIVAALAAFGFGAVWYMRLAEPWMSDAGVERGADGRPSNASNPAPYVTSLLCLILVAGMMRHVFALSGIDGFGKGLVSGLGLGLFIATPWIATNYTFAGKPKRLILIDGGYATIGCTVIGAVLGLF